MKIWDDLSAELKKYKKTMDRMFYFFLAYIIVTEFMKNTWIVVILCNLILYGLSTVAPQMSMSTATLIYGMIWNIQMLLVIPAIYVIVAEMKTRREKITGVFFLLLGWFYTIHMREWNDMFIFRVMLLIVASYGKDFRKIVKTAIVTIAVCLLITTVLSLLKVIPEFNTERNGRVRRSFGVTSPIGYAAHLSMIALMILFLRNGILRWYHYTVIVAMTAFNVIFIDGRVSMLSSFLAIGGTLIYSILRRSNLKIPDKFLGFFRKTMAFSYVLIAGMFFLMTYIYKADNDAFYHHIPFLSTFESRIEVPHRLINKIGISVFGNYMEHYGETETELFINGEYNFLDSSYSRMLMIYGIVGLILTLWVFTRVQWRLMEKKQTFRMYLLSVVALNYVVERFLMDPMYQVFMLLFFATIPLAEEKNNGEKEKKDELQEINTKVV